MPLIYRVILFLSFNSVFLSSYAADLSGTDPRLVIYGCEPEPPTHTKAGRHSFTEKESLPLFTPEELYTGITDDKNQLFGEEPALRSQRGVCLSTCTSSQTSSNLHQVSSAWIIEQIGELRTKQLADAITTTAVFPEAHIEYKIQISLLPGIITEESKMKMVPPTDAHPTLEEALETLYCVPFNSSIPIKNIITKTAEGYQKINELKVGQYYSGLCITFQSFPLAKR